VASRAPIEAPVRPAADVYPAGAVLMAPLSGYTDAPFRLLCRRYGCRFAFTPLIAARSLIHRNPKATPLLYRSPAEPWLGVQLEAGDPDVLSRAVLLLADRDFQVLDLNLGCPVAKVTRKGAGAALLLKPDLACRCIEALAAGPFPVTAKVRILDEQDPTPTIRLAKALRNAGIRALTIHGRTPARFYSGPVAAHVIRAVRENVDLPVIANGGIRTRHDACELRNRTGCRRIMVARGAIGNPWIFREILSEALPPPPTHDEVCDAVEEHVRGMVRLYGESVGMRNARKIILSYLTGRGYRRTRRREVTSVSTLQGFLELLHAIRCEGPSPRYVSPRPFYDPPDPTDRADPREIRS